MDFIDIKSGAILPYASIDSKGLIYEINLFS
jgi:hypothetical protein